MNKDIVSYQHDSELHNSPILATSFEEAVGRVMVAYPRAEIHNVAIGRKASKARETQTYIVRWESIIEATSREEAAIVATTQPRIFMEVRRDIDPMFYSVDLTKPSSKL